METKIDEEHTMTIDIDEEVKVYVDPSGLIEINHFGRWIVLEQLKTKTPILCVGDIELLMKL